MIKDDRLSYICLKALLAYGPDNQLGMVQEEAGELITAISHAKRGRKNMGELVGECADMIIVLRQLEIMLEVQGVDVGAEVKKKLERLEKRLEESDGRSRAD